MENSLIIFNWFYIDANMFRNLHQHDGCSVKYSFCFFSFCEYVEENTLGSLKAPLCVSVSNETLQGGFRERGE